jgi:hypothetical protein
LNNIIDTSGEILASPQIRAGQQFAGKKANATSQYVKRLSLPTVKKM